MRKVCLLNRGSVRSQMSRDKNYCHGLTKEESMYSIILKKDLQLCKRLCSEKLKSVKFRRFPLGEIRAFGRVTFFRAFLPLNGIFQKDNLISFSYLPRPSN